MHELHSGHPFKSPKPSQKKKTPNPLGPTSMFVFSAMLCELLKFILPDFNMYELKMKHLWPTQRSGR